MKFEEYYKQMGFEKYPFRDRTAEKEDTGRLFIKPEQYCTFDITDMKEKKKIVSEINKETYGK